MTKDEALEIATKTLELTPRDIPIIIEDDNGEVIGVAAHRQDNSQLKFEFREDGSATIAEDMSDTAEDGSPLWLWHDHVIFTDDVKSKFLDLPQGERAQFTMELLDQFYAKNPEYANFARAEIFQDPMLLLNFFKSLTLEDFNNGEIRAADLRFDSLTSAIENAEFSLARTPINIDNLATFWPILQIRDLFTESEMATLYYIKNPRISGRELARQLGAIGSVGGRQAIISNSRYRGYLDQKPNNFAYISYVGASYWDQIETDEAGNLYEREEARILRKAREQGKGSKRRAPEKDQPEEIPEGINKNLAGTLFAAMLKTSVRNGNEFTIYLPEFVREMNKHYKIDVDEYDENGRPNDKYDQARAEEQQREDQAKAARAAGEKSYINKSPSIMQDLRSLNDWVGILHGEEVRQILTIVGLNVKANTITVVTPYFDALTRAVKEDQLRKVEEAKQLYEKPNWNWLIHSSMAKERNQAAVAVVVRITNGLLNRGKKPASEFKENKDKEKAAKQPHYAISFETLINEVPELQRRYNNTKATADKNKLLSRTFTKVYELLKTKTDAYKYFVDLDVSESIPTTTTLDSKLVISFNGTNPEFNKG